MSCKSSNSPAFAKSEYPASMKGDLKTFMDKSEQEITWVSADHKVLKISEMTNNHIYNILDWLKGKPLNTTYLNRSFGEWANIFVAERNKRAAKVRKQRDLQDAEQRLKALDAELEGMERVASDLAKKFEIVIGQRTRLANNIESFKKEWGF